MNRNQLKIILRVVLLIYFALNSQMVFGESVEKIICIGPKNAEQFFVYLHGMDNGAPSALEQQNQKILEAIAFEKNIKIAMPRARNVCPDGVNFCWTWYEKSAKDLKPAVEAIKSAANQCFGKEKFGLIGFSNGGFLVNKIFQYGINEPVFQWLISIDAAGLQDNNSFASPNAGKLIMLLGDKEKNPSYIIEYYQYLKSLNRNIELIRYDGGHEIEKKSLEHSLEKVMGRNRN